MNHPIYWLYKQHGGAPLSPTMRFCYLCGANVAGERTVTAGIADTFNSHALARCPSSPYLCDACFWYFDSKIGHPDFRKMSLLVSKRSWTNWQRETMKQDVVFWLTRGLPEDMYLVVSLSKKKHILLQAPLNGAGSRVLAIQVEEQVAHCTLQDWQTIDEPFMSLLRLGHNKVEILSGQLYGNTLRKHGRLIEALQHSEQLERWRKSPIIELYSYTTILEEKKEDAGEADRDRAGSVQPRTGDPASGGGTPARRVERHRSGLPEQVSSRDLAAIRGEDSSSGPDHEQLSLFPLQACRHVPGGRDRQG